MTSPRSATPPSKQDINRYLQHVTSEREAAALYRGLAQVSGRRRRPVFEELAEIEDRHAAFWVERLRSEGVTVPPAADHKIGTRTMELLQTARRHSPDLVLPIIERDERDGMSVYLDDPDAPEHLVSEEAEHARILGQMLTEARRDEAEETWHRNDKSGALRASIFGINDGLVSNTALVMGFAGAATDNKVVLLAGLSGLLAGAFSMGAGEYISMANQREAYEREIALERDEIQFLPDDERRELELIYRAKGLGEEEARAVRRAGHVGPRRRPRHDGARGARARPRRPRVAVARRVLQLHRVRPRRHRRRAALPVHVGHGRAPGGHHPGAGRDDPRRRRHGRAERSADAPLDRAPDRRGCRNRGTTYRSAR